MHAPSPSGPGKVLGRFALVSRLHLHSKHHHTPEPTTANEIPTDPQNPKPAAAPRSLKNKPLRVQSRPKTQCAQNEATANPPGSNKCSQGGEPAHLLSTSDTAPCLTMASQHHYVLIQSTIFRLDPLKTELQLDDCVACFWPWWLNLWALKNGLPTSRMVDRPKVSPGALATFGPETVLSP